MNLLDIVRRPVPPVPWAEGEKIPWDDPAFSTRMLREHLSQAHDAASRRTERIAAQVRWIHDHLLGGQATRVLDLACGPGLYTAQLAALGHQCVGIDFAPASIAHARDTAAAAELACTYHLADIRMADYGDSVGLVMLTFGEFNVFRPADARAILAKAHRALAPGGLLLLEAHTYAAVERLGMAPRSWRTAEQSLFSERPHLRLDESAWEAEEGVATHRYLIIDAETAAVAWYAETVQAYTEADYRSLLLASGFLLPTIAPGWDEAGEAEPGDFILLVGSAV
jgi:SAM-dependent methyltransferase